MDTITILRDNGTECMRVSRGAILAVSRYDYYEGEERTGGGCVIHLGGPEIRLENTNYDEIVKAWIGG